MKFSFSKYSGCGNDFILIDNRSLFFPDQNREFIEYLCNRNKGIGADGVILLENDHKENFRMRIFNANGQEAEMCGNGIRCLMKFINELGIKKNKCTIATMLRPLAVEISGDMVSVDMGDPFDVKLNLQVSVDDKTFTVHHVNTGVPHAILFVDNLNSININTIGPKFRHHPKFGSKGANFNVAHILPTGEIWNRTYERGVEGETLACGTGCVAVAVAANELYRLPSPIRVRTLSLDVLEVQFKLANNLPTELKLIGPAKKIFNGEIELDNRTLA